VRTRLAVCVPPFHFIIVCYTPLFETESRPLGPCLAAACCYNPKLPLLLFPSSLLNQPLYPMPRHRRHHCAPTCSSPSSQSLPQSSDSHPSSVVIHTPRTSSTTSNPRVVSTLPTPIPSNTSTSARSASAPLIAPMEAESDPFGLRLSSMIWLVGNSFFLGSFEPRYLDSIVVPHRDSPF
jgi:hypothetical protein